MPIEGSTTKYYRLLPAVLAALKEDADSISWPERVAIVHTLRAAITSTPLALDAVAVLELLAADPKPEVRQAVASLLTVLSDADFTRVQAKLAYDDNAFVRKSVERAVEKRQKAARAAAKTMIGVDQVAQELDTLRERHGDAAARQAWEICERQTEMLVGSMVHDLRSILTHLKANTTTLAQLATSREPSRSATVAARAKDDIEFLERTIRDMEEFTKPLTSERAEHSLAQLARSAHEIAAESVRSDGQDPGKVQVRIDVPDRIRLNAAKHLIVTALANVIKNAYEALVGSRAGGDPGRIEIAAAEDGLWAELIVRDNGMGFSPEEAGALLLRTPGRRNKTKRNSTGYGLPNAVRNLAAHGGTIRFESEEGKGTSVIIRLPLEGKVPA